MTTVIIHGLGQNVSSWETVMTGLHDKHIVCVDFTMLSNDVLSYDILYQEVKRVCDDINTPVRLVGLSLGGVLALNYAIDFPHKVESLIVVNTQYKMPKKLLTLQNIVFKCLPKKIFDKIGLTKSNAIHITKSMLHLDFTQQLNQIKTPTRVVIGAKDKANIKAGIMLSQLLLNGELHVIEHGKHELNVTHPDELAQVINDCHDKN